MRSWFSPLFFAAATVALPAAAQVWSAYPPTSQADIHRYRLEQQRLRSADQAAFARQQSLNSRLVRLETEAARQPAPYVALVGPLPSLSGSTTPSIAAATARREAVSDGVGQIDAWLDRGPR